MKKLKRGTMLGIIFVIAAGSLAHFLYDWSGRNHIVGLFTPINESIWEHMKLLFFPMLFYSIILILKLRKDFPNITSSFCFGIIAGTICIPVFFYTYTALLGKDCFIMDIGTFILSILIAYNLSYKLTLSRRRKPYMAVFCICVCILFVCFMVFTYHTPDAQIFKEPSIFS